MQVHAVDAESRHSALWCASCRRHNNRCDPPLVSAHSRYHHPAMKISAISAPPLRKGLVAGSRRRGWSASKEHTNHKSRHTLTVGRRVFYVYRKRRREHPEHPPPPNSRASRIFNVFGEVLGPTSQLPRVAATVF